MSLNRHKTFSNNVAHEFKRRENDFGVSKQSSTSQATLASPINDEQDNKWNGTGGRTVWSRVSSGVIGYRRDDSNNRESLEKSSIDSLGGIKTISTRIDGDPKENEINGIVLETNYKAEDMYGINPYPGFRSIAKVLFNKDSTSNLLNSNNNLQIFSDRGQPGPVLESISINHQGSWGMIKEADVTWRAFSQEQFETLSHFLCNVQKTVVVEYGWSSHRKPTLDLSDIEKVKYLQSNQIMALVKKDNENFYESEKQFIESSRQLGTASQNNNDLDFESLTPYEIEQERRGADYDVFIGIIKNFVVQIEDGAYVVTTKLVSMSPAVISSRNSINNYFETRFNTDIDHLRLNKDPRVWYKPSSLISPTFSSNSDATVQEEITQTDLSKIEDFWKIMRNPEGHIFYNKSRAVFELQPENRFRSTGLEDHRWHLYTPEFITDLQYVTDLELKRALIRGGKLLKNWKQVEPDVVNPDGVTIGLIFGAVLGGIAGGPGGVLIGGGIGAATGEAMSTFAKEIDNSFDERNWQDIRIFIQKIAELSGVSITGKLLEVFSRRYPAPILHFDYPEIDPYKWLDPLMDQIRYVLERQHRQYLGMSKIPPFIPGAIDEPQDKGKLEYDINFGDPTYNTVGNRGSIIEKVYNYIKVHLSENSSGRAYLDNGIQFGTDFAFNAVRDVFNPFTDYRSPRLDLRGGKGKGIGSDRETEITLARFAAIQHHLGTIDAPNVDIGNDSTFSLLSRDKKLERHSYSFITWGLLEELLNAQFVSKTSKFLKLDSSTTKIRFHENLISTDGDVCILPNKNAPRFDKGILVDGSRYDLSINGISHRDVGNDTSGKLEEDEAWLYSIFVSTDLIKSVFGKTETMKDALRELLDYISGALIDNYEFRIDQRGSTASVVDVAYSKYDSSTERYRFKFNQATSFIRNIDSDISHTTQTQMQAIYGMHSDKDNNIYGPFESSITPIVSKGKDNLDLFAQDLIESDESDTVQNNTDKLDSKPGDGHFGNFWINHESGWANYVYPDKETIVKHIYGLDVNSEPINSGTTIPNLSVSITLDGISGIRYWDAFNIDYIPAIYNEQGFFFVTSINQSIVAGDWVTTIIGNYRLKSVSR